MTYELLYFNSRQSELNFSYFKHFIVTQSRQIDKHRFLYRKNQCNKLCSSRSCTDYCQLTMRYICFSKTPQQRVITASFVHQTSRAHSYLLYTTIFSLNTQTPQQSLSNMHRALLNVIPQLTLVTAKVPGCCLAERPASFLTPGGQWRGWVTFALAGLRKKRKQSEIKRRRASSRGG